MFFILPSNGSQDDIDILDSGIFSSVVSSSVKFTSSRDNRTCSHSIDVSWSDNANIRKELDSVLCVFVFKGGISCKTENVSLVFSGEF